MKFNAEFVAGIVYIAVFVGMTMGTVGQTSVAERIGWDMPLKIFLAVAFPFVMGLIAGKKS